MDYDQYMGFDEQDAFEARYADELEMLNEIEGDSSKPSQDNSNKSGGRRQLFQEEEPDQCTSKKHFLSDADFENDLVIDEDLLSLSPKRKKAKMDSCHFMSKNCNLPTTLDCDREEREHRKQRKMEQDDLGSPAMIEKILRYRENKHKGSSEEFLNTTAQSTASGHKFQLTKVLVVPPMHSDFISTTSTDGQRCYMRMYSEEKLFKKVDQTAMITGIKSQQLLPETVSDMRQAIYIMREKRIVLESHRITEEIRRRNINDTTNAVATTVETEEASMPLFPNVVVQVHKPENDLEEDEGIYSEDESSKHGLWLDKFAPTQYTHLLSDESVNRSLLRWLKMWDHVVFGREVQPKKEHKQPQEGKNFMKKPPFHSVKDDLSEKMDEYNRPFWKVSLLFGPPGLGKTTLAHIIAKHAGYHVVEMNASDDRSADAFRTKLEETTQMKSVLGQDERPNCLIIDEIDGAPQAAINVLLTAINKTRRNENKKGLGRKKGGAKGILLRPIICICNDLYVPSLRQLRQQSLMLQFPQTQSARLASRLSQLCRIQRLQCDMTTLLTLCEKSDNDIRSCINTLQFAKSSGKKKLGLETIKGLEIGQKDQHKNIFHVWHEIFQLPKNKRKMEKDAEAAQLSSGVTGQKMNNLSARLYTVHNLVTANGDYDKTLLGVYENYLKMKFKDHNMLCVNKAEEWLQFYDCLSQINHHLQDWSVMRYYPYLFVIFHMMFACVRVPRISFPIQNMENTKRLQKSENLLESMYCEMTPSARCFTSRRTAILDSVPYILAIMTPTIRPVNTQLFSTAEWKLVKDLVSTMLSYNLTFRQERNEDGHYSYVLEPNVAEVCEYEGSQDHRKLTYATKQMIAKEVEMERMRRSERMMESQATQEEKVTKTNTTSRGLRENKTKENTSGPKPIPNHLQRLENSISQASLPKEKPVVDFFSRFKKVKKVEMPEDQENKKKAPPRDPGIGNSQIWYKFNEGFSNAVRQTVYMKEFL